jgi:hypothetical protein
MLVYYMRTGTDVRVSSKHKRDGIPNDFHNCAIALAIKDTTDPVCGPVEDVVVGRDVVSIKYKDGTIRKYRHSASSRRLVAIFDIAKGARSLVDPKPVVIHLNPMPKSQHPEVRKDKNAEYRKSGAAKPHGPRDTKPKTDPLTVLGVRNGSSAPAMSI